MQLLQLSSALLLSLLLELPEGPLKTLELHLLHPQLPPPTPSLSLRKKALTRPFRRCLPPSAPTFLAPGPSAHLDLKGFCGVLSLLKLALEHHQCLCLLLQEPGGKSGRGTPLAPFHRQ